MSAIDVLDAMLSTLDEDDAKIVTTDEIRKGSWVWSGSRWRPVTGWERWGKAFLIQSGTETVLRLSVGDPVTVHTSPNEFRDAVAVLKIKMYQR